MRSLLPFLSLAACVPQAQIPLNHGDGPTPECDPVITIPVGSLDSEGPVVAQPHAATFGVEPDPVEVHLGAPSRDISDSVSFLWRTDTATFASQALIGPADTFPDGATLIDGYSFLYGGGAVGAGSWRMHELRLCDSLEPGTTYTYQVGGEGHWSEAHDFSTPGAPGSFEHLRIAFAGDSRGGYEAWGEALARMDAQEPDLVVFSGDVVNLGANEVEWEQWFDASGDVLARRLVLPAHGNHEFLAQAYFAWFGMPGNEQWYAFDLGDLLLLTLNDTVKDQTDITESQVAFIEEELGATTARWRLANHHQAAWSTCKTHGSNMTARQAWTGPLEEGGVQLVVAGHNHVYERSVPISHSAEAASAAEGVTYIVTGGAGGPLYDCLEPDWFNAVGSSTKHYMIGDFSPEGAEFSVYDLSDNIIDSFSIPE